MAELYPHHSPSWLQITIQASAVLALICAAFAPLFVRILVFVIAYGICAVLFTACFCCCDFNDMTLWNLSVYCFAAAIMLVIGPAIDNELFPASVALVFSCIFYTATGTLLCFMKRWKDRGANDAEETADGNAVNVEEGLTSTLTNPAVSKGNKNKPDPIDLQSSNIAATAGSFTTVEKTNADGSKEITKTTINEDGSKTIEITTYEASSDIDLGLCCVDSTD